MKWHAALQAGLLAQAATSLSITNRTQDPKAMCAFAPNDPTFWQSYNMQKFVQQTAHVQIDELYAIPSPESKNRVPFLQYLINNLPSTARGQFTCDIDKRTCDTDNLDCKSSPELIKTITAIIHYRDFLQEASGHFDSARLDAHEKLPEMGERFNPSTKSSLPSGYGNLAAGLGIVGSLAGLVPIFGSYASTAVSIGTNAMNLLATPGNADLEVRFNSYAELMDQLSKFTLAIKSTLDKLVQDIFTLIPPDDFGLYGPHTGWESDPMQLPSAIAGGAFAASTSPQWDQITGLMKASIYAQALNHLWNREKVVVMKISKNGLEIDPCDPKQPDILFGRNVKYCDNDGNMLVLQAQKKENVRGIDPADYQVPGFPSLADYNLTPRDVLKSSWENRGKRSKGLQAAKDVLTELTKLKSVTDPVVYFNLTVCDLDKVTIEPEKRNRSAPWETCRDWIL
ncbi:hypothetical protein AMS68_005358 [Peltaster fructicola]|uniref:DUF7872 domain-containing protein n=1 Tax=Peltaster fructicola TaxID=286661 RepID=A0A6H0XYV4_9PEZI|nr:hypothetical protein AMS68_005358 [Peltaster fructicola]